MKDFVSKAAVQSMRKVSATLPQNALESKEMHEKIKFDRYTRHYVKQNSSRRPSDLKMSSKSNSDRSHYSVP